MSLEFCFSFKRVDDILLEINDKNYEFLLDIISEITLDKEKEELFSMFDIFLDNIENSYISKFKILYREIRKEIEISKKFSNTTIQYFSDHLLRKLKVSKIK